MTYQKMTFWIAVILSIAFMVHINFLWRHITRLEEVIKPQIIETACPPCPCDESAKIPDGPPPSRSKRP
jgi:hypothetical protein